ncbi:hypothetical protein PV327_000851 [Microctonus hyperodae]|uniref:von Hippel-Lindau disease tumour suppressor beta domain-containing protein n=1 Tax=Microctonus hyperodae TaxID=165561 RepID=A0AA39G802_MICHY|nr:hypothetical protein PV327_000851 [Microctonus hyperodae]
MVNNNPIIPLLKSIENRERVLVTFINTTPYTAEILWINFEGQAVRYAVLDSHKACGINTYVTHPWIFMERETGDRFMVEGKDVYMPRAVCSTQNMLMDSRSQRINVFITLPIYTLRDIAMRVIKRHLRYDKQAFTLDIPRALQYELALLLPKKGDPKAP